VFSLLLLPLKAIKWFVKLSGVRGGLLLLLGVAVGMLVAPERGAVMRARLRARIDEVRAGRAADGFDPIV
jgi:hypothetical protein